MDKSLESLLYVDHKGDLSDSSKINLHLASFTLIYDILYNEKYKNSPFYESKGFRTLVEEIQQNIPKDIFIEVDDGDCIINNEHSKINTFTIYWHALQYIMVQLGF